MDGVRVQLAECRHLCRPAPSLPLGQPRQRTRPLLGWGCSNHATDALCTTVVLVLLLFSLLL